MPRRGPAASLIRFCSAALLLAGAPAASQEECRGASWVWFGADVVHCPGGLCDYDPASDDGEARYRLSAEPWLRAIEDSTAPGLVEGDVLVAVNGYLITTPSGGTELATLDPTTAARLTVRRDDRLVEVDVQPQRRCGEPLMLVGNSLLQRRQDRGRPTRPSASDTPASHEPSSPEAGVIDLTRPFRTGRTALDMSLGMVLQCGDCTLRSGEKRWDVEDYPTVSKVVSGGVADEAGLRVGDRVRSIQGRDLRSRRGGQLLFSPPRGDFELGYVRAGRSRTASINRHVVDQRIRQVVDRRVVRIERGENGWDPEVLGALARGWSQLRQEGSANFDLDEDPEGDRRWIVSGSRWGLPAWGLLFEAPDGRFFVVNGAPGDVRARLLSKPRVAEVEAGGPADVAGVKVGDVLLEIDGHPILGSNGTRRLLLGDPRKRVHLQLQRGGDTTGVTLRPETRR